MTVTVSSRIHVTDYPWGPWLVWRPIPSPSLGASINSPSSRGSGNNHCISPSSSRFISPLQHHQTKTDLTLLQVSSQTYRSLTSLATSSWIFLRPRGHHCYCDCQRCREISSHDRYEVICITYYQLYRFCRYYWVQLWLSVDRQQYSHNICGTTLTF